ncbi:MAG: phosphatase PAP2-related protein [Candidatus Gracilibacteria bacterium]|jgi:membrane-associated phospholipid phosphatase
MIKEYFLKTLHHWKILLKDKAYVWSLIVGVLVLCLAVFTDRYASLYHDQHVYSSVGDLILNNIPTYNLEFLFFQGIYAIILMIAFYSVFFEPEMVPFGLKTFGLLIIVRAGFIILTYLGPPQGFYFGDGVIGADSPLKGLFFTNDLFFSGHTALPFLAYLLFKKNWWFRVIMLIGAFGMGIVVLLMHIHYSIDVFSAFFITYGIYALSNNIFNKLNLRFQQRIELYGWKSLRDRIQKMKNINP